MKVQEYYRIRNYILNPLYFWNWKFLKLEISENQNYHETQSHKRP